MVKDQREGKQLQLKILNMEKVFSEPTSDSQLEGELSPFLPVKLSQQSNVVGFTEFFFPEKRKAQIEQQEEGTHSDGKNFLDFLKESMSVSQSTKPQSSVNSLEFKTASQSNKDSQEQSLIEFVQEYNWEQPKNPPSQTSNKKKVKEYSSKQLSVKLSKKTRKEKK